MRASLKHLLLLSSRPLPTKLLTLPCAQMSLSLSIFYPIFFFALEFEHSISGTQREYIIFCPASPETSLLSLLSSSGNLLLCGLPDDLPCHFDGSVGQSTLLLMNRPQSQKSYLTKAKPLKVKGSFASLLKLQVESMLILSIWENVFFCVYFSECWMVLQAFRVSG